jgi:hypothetical protein
MNSRQLLTDAFWLLPLILQAAIALVMIRRKLVTIFPFFFSYTIAVFSKDIALMFVPYGRHAYALVYWYAEALAVSLGFAVIFEILRNILPPSASLKFVLNAVWVLATVVAVIAVVMLVLDEPGAEKDRVLEVIVLAERSVRFLQACLLIVVIALMSRLALTWRDESVGITAGFGIYSALALAVYQFGYHLHSMSTTAFLLLNSGAYNVATIIWAFYILRPVRVTPVEHLPKADLAEWNSAVTDYVHQWSRRY